MFQPSNSVTIDNESADSQLHSSVKTKLFNVPDTVSDSQLMELCSGKFTQADNVESQSFKSPRVTEISALLGKVLLIFEYI